MAADVVRADWRPHRRRWLPLMSPGVGPGVPGSLSMDRNDCARGEWGVGGRDACAPLVSLFGAFSILHPLAIFAVYNF